MKPFKPVALGLSITNEKAGVTNNSNLMASHTMLIELKWVKV